MSNERELRFTEQVSSLVDPETRDRLDAIAAKRRATGTPWPDYSFGAVVRDALTAGLPLIEQSSNLTT